MLNFLIKLISNTVKIIIKDKEEDDSINVGESTDNDYSGKRCKVESFSLKTREWLYLYTSNCHESNGYFVFFRRGNAFLVPTPPVCDQRSMTTTGYGMCMMDWSHVGRGE